MVQKAEEEKIKNASSNVFAQNDAASSESMGPIIVGPSLPNEIAKTEDLVARFRTLGIQASKLAEAVEIINEMILKKKELQVEHRLLGNLLHPERCTSGCTIFLGFTSNLMSSGLREIFCYLAKHNLIDCIVTTAGGIEEDFIKCLEDFHLGDFQMDGVSLRADHLNRIGNILAPNSAYCKFEKWLNPILDQMLEDQLKKGTKWTPSKMIRLLGQKINDPRSVYYWAWRNRIPVFCPAITDGSIGDIMSLINENCNEGDDHLRIDVIEDHRELNNIAVYSIKTGMIILGGGTTKHQICNANLMRNGAEYCVYVNTGLEHDASDSGASVDEAKSWGKVKGNAKSVKVFCDASIAFPLIAASTFFKEPNRIPSE